METYKNTVWSVAIILMVMCGSVIACWLFDGQSLDTIRNHFYWNAFLVGVGSMIGVMFLEVITAPLED